MSYAAPGFCCDCAAVGRGRGYRSCRAAADRSRDCGCRYGRTPVDRRVGRSRADRRGGAATGCGGAATDCGFAA